MQTRNLLLPIKQEYYDQILAGTKKIETREVTYENMLTYCDADCDYIYTYDDGNIIPREYDTVTFMAKDREQMVVKVDKIKVFMLLDEETNKYEMKQDEYGLDYYPTVAEIHLAEVISK